jgi:hypothetical protein
MDHWTHHSTEVEVPDTPPPLLNEDSLVVEVRRARAKQAEAARVAEVERAQAFDAVGSPAEADVPLPFATPPGVALTF